MVIRSMNNLFQKHGRWLFAIITIFIIVSFVGFLTPGFTSLFSKQARHAPIGSVFGEPLTPENFREQIRMGAVGMAVQFGANPASNMIAQMAEMRAFRTICWAKAAFRRGIRVSDREVADFIKKLPAFMDENKFSVDKYEKYISGTLVKNGFSREELDNAVKQSLAISKLNSQITDSIIVTPNELRDYFDKIQEKIDARVIRFKAKDFAESVEINDKDLKLFYEANKDNYKTNPMIRANTVRFNYIDFEKVAAASVKTADLKKYYESHEDEFTEGEGKKKKTLSFEKAVTTIKAKLVKDRSRRLAMEAAQKFAEKAYENFEEAMDTGKDAEKSFFEAASEIKKEVKDTGWFADNAKKINAIGEEPEFISAVARIYEKIPVSDAIPGKRAAFVAFLSGKKPAVNAEFKSVKSKLLKDLRKIKALKIAREKARAAAAVIVKSKNIPEKITRLGEKMKIEKLDTFIPMYKNRLYTKNNATVADLAISTSEKNISEVRNIPEGALFVYVSKKHPPTEEEFKKQEKTVKEQYLREKQFIAVKAFDSWVNSHCSGSFGKQN